MTNNAAVPTFIRWAGYLALSLLIIIPLAVLTVRSGAWQQGLGLYALSTLGSTLLAIVFVVLLLLPKFGAIRAETGKRLLLTIPGVILTLSLTSGRDAPPIHDISTDMDDPPLFVTAAQQRGEGANTLDIKPDFMAQQKTGYPDIATTRSSLPPAEAFDRALQVASEMGWEVYHQDAGTGIIEAVDTTAIMQFKDDVVIRVRAGAGGSEIDLRSVSRVGLSDLGANAARIRAFQVAFGGDG